MTHPVTTATFAQTPAGGPNHAILILLLLLLNVGRDPAAGAAVTVSAADTVGSSTAQTLQTPQQDDVAWCSTLLLHACPSPTNVTHPPTPYSSA
jgi:hypothetical protein